MEQIISTTPAPTAPATTAAVPLAVTATATAEGGAETDSAAQFSALLVAIQTGAAPVPAATAPAEEEHAETSDDDAEGAPAAATAAAATAVVPVALPVPVQQTLAPLVSISAHARGTKSVEAAVLPPVVTDAVVAADAAPAEAGTAPIITVAPATAATVTTDRVAPIVLPSSPALPDGDVDPALVEAAIAAAPETVPARPAAATTTTRPAVHAVDTAPDVVAEKAPAAEEQSTVARPAANPTTDAPVQSAAPADRHEGSSTGSGQGGRLDLQVQAAPRTAEAPPDAVETPVAVIDRERVERLAEGLAARLKVSHAADGARIRMQLEPRELGEVVVRLEIRNGIAHAHLIAESADAGTALQASLSDLRASLADRGLQLDSVSIRVAGEGASSARDQAAQSQGDRHPRAPLSFGRIDEVGTIAATDQIDRAREGQAVWMLA
jgi:flagellar hook-length control protein FliK